MTPTDAERKKAVAYRKQYLTTVCLACSAGEKSDLRDACDMAQEAFATAIMEARMQERERLQRLLNSLIDPEAPGGWNDCGRHALAMIERNAAIREG